MIHNSTEPAEKLKDKNVCLLPRNRGGGSIFVADPMAFWGRGLFQRWSVLYPLRPLMVIIFNLRLPSLHSSGLILRGKEHLLSVIEFMHSHRSRYEVVRIPNKDKGMKVQKRASNVLEWLKSCVQSCAKKGLKMYKVVQAKTEDL